MKLPQDSYILLSYINTKLRDQYASLSDLTEDLELDADELSNRLAGISYRYDSRRNAFVPNK